jgi:lipoyl(octanoyl) transferase
MNKINYQNLGLVPYKKAWDYQLELFNQLLENKKAEKQNREHHLLFVNHPHVFTIGRNGNDNNLLINSQLLEQKGIELFHIDRGGDITYHGPGQQVVYPIFDLDEFKMNTREFVFRLEEAVINTLKEFSIKSSRLEGAAGIWLDADDKSKSRKICAIGIRSSRRVTMHGIALNIATDLDYFSFMNPCGFTDKGVTSIQKELNKPVDYQLVSSILKNKIVELFPN